MPAYFYPGVLWQQARSAQESWVIANPNSGPGIANNQDYALTIAQSKVNGLRVIGYVSTGYASRPLSAVQDEIEKYYSWYGVDGIFLDEVATDIGHVAYYKTLAGNIRAHATGLVVLNPGTMPDEQYIALADTTVVFEGTARSYSSFVAPAWVWNYPSSKFAHLIYQVSSASLKNVMNRSRNTNAGFFYATNDTSPNPWDTLPGYWNTELKSIKN